MKTAALIVAAGSGVRAGGGRPKQYRMIGGKALLAHAIDHLDHPAIDLVQVVIGAGQEALYRDAVGDRPLPPPVIGGATRRESVRAGLDALAEQGVARVLIHDAARAFLPASVIDRLIAALSLKDGAVPVLPVADTMAQADGAMLGNALDRDALRRVQTPQAFALAAIRDAHAAWTGDATDDAQVARGAGLSVAMVEGDARLEKLTYDSDFARRRDGMATMITRTGMGFDVHAFAADTPLWLGGVHIPHDRGLSGHSDADVALHALTDALLGAAGDGDIGSHFPPSDPQWKGAASDRFLIHARERIMARGGIIDHVDVTIICEAPRIGPHRPAMRARIAELLGLPEVRVSIKATTTERLGFAGRGEGIAAQAIATIRLPEDL